MTTRRSFLDQCRKGVGKASALAIANVMAAAVACRRTTRCCPSMATPA